jgi:hypothetical protein
MDLAPSFPCSFGCWKQRIIFSLVVSLTIEVLDELRQRTLE